MHQTTIRFGSDLWDALAVAASAEGVSVAQYVRESAVERLVRTGAADGGPPVAATDRRREARTRRAPAPPATEPVRPVRRGPDTERRADMLARIAVGERAAARNAEASAAVWAQSRLARARSRELRAASRALAAERRAAREAPAPGPAGSAGSGSGDAVPRASHARA